MTSHFDILEGTAGPVADLDCGDLEIPDLGTDLCQKDKDLPEDNKPVELTLTYSFGDAIDVVALQEDGKYTVDTDAGYTDDGEVYIVVLGKDEDGDPLFEGTITEGESFVITEGGSKLDSETHVKIYDNEAAFNNGDDPVQDIEFHTSCSQPLFIGDTYGSISVNGAKLGGGATFGLQDLGQTIGDSGVEYEISGPDADWFYVDPDTGVVSFANEDGDGPGEAPTFVENGDNYYRVTVTAYELDEDGNRAEVCDVKDLSFCVEDYCVVVLENTTFAIDLGLGGTTERGIEFQNAGFESDALGDGSYNSEIDGWVQDSGSSGSWDPEGSDFAGGVIGENVAWLEGSGATISQSLSETYDNGSSYSIQLDLSNSVHYGGQSYTVNLYAGADKIGSASGSTSGDGFTTVSVTDTDGGAAQDGEQLRIEIIQNSSGELFVDNVRGTVTEDGGDAGVTYSIVGGPDGALFDVDPDTGVVSFKEAPDFEDPKDAGGDNKYIVAVRATDENGEHVDKVLDFCVQDACIVVTEGTSDILFDLDCGDPDIPDLGTDLCQKDKDLPEDNKPVELTLTYSFGDAIDVVALQEDGKYTVDTDAGYTDDGEVYIVVLGKDEDGDPLFEGTITEGESFVITEGGSKLDSETHVKIYDNEAAFNNGDDPVQDIEFHTSCSQPLFIGDTYGSISVNGAKLGGGATFGLQAGDDVGGDAGILYTLSGPDADKFYVDPDTGEVSFANEDGDGPGPAPAHDEGGDNTYEVIVTGTDTESGEVCHSEYLEFCVEDDCVVIKEGASGVLYDIDTDCDEESEVPDLGTDLCQKDKDLPHDNKPTLLTLTYNFGTETDVVNNQDSGKSYVETNEPGGSVDGEVYIVVLRKADKRTGEQDVEFEGYVKEGESFDVGNGRSKLSSETHVEIYEDKETYDNGGDPLQDIEFHTSCSQPLHVGDTYGSIAVNGAKLGGGDTFGLSAEEANDQSGGGVTYELTGPDADKFWVDPETGEVYFANEDGDGPGEAPDHIDNGDNKYEVTVTATDEDGAECFVKSFEFCVEDDCVVVTEGTTGVLVDVDADCGEPDIPDLGTDLCQKDKDLPEDNKPVELTLTYSFGDAIDVVALQEDGKYTVDTDAGYTDDGEVYIVVLGKDEDGDPLFEGTITEGESFVITEGGSKLDSETHVKIYDNEAAFNNGDDPVQDIEFHTSCSQPLFVGDTYGSISINGAVLGGGDSFGLGAGDDLGGDEGIIYSLSGPDADKFWVDPDTGEVSFANEDGTGPGAAPAYVEDGDNKYEVTVIGTDLDTDEVCHEEDLEFCIEDDCIPPETGSLGGRYFCDTDDDNDDNNNGNEPAVVGLTVELLNADGTPALDNDGNPVASVLTDQNGEYCFDNLAPGDYRVRFETPSDGKTFVEQNAGVDDTSDSDVDTGTGVSDVAAVVSGQKTENVDAGIEEPPTPPGSLGGRYFCDTDDDNDDNNNGNEPAVVGLTVELLNADGTPALDNDGNPVASVLTDQNGEYCFDNLAPGDYRVRFETPSDGKTFVEQNAGVDDTSDSDVDTGTGVSDVAAVVSGQKTENVDAGIEEPPTPPGSLGGRYFCDTDDDNDDNNNGNEPAVVGLTVELLNADGTPALDNDGNPVASVLTDQNGEYCFDNLAPGDYRVRFETPSDGKTFVEQNAGVDDTSDSDVDTGTGVSDVAAVVSGQKTENVDAGIEEPPTPPGSLGGRYFCDTDDDNDDNNNGNEPAVVGLTVELLNADGTPALDNDGNPVASVLTDQNGEYCFDNLAPGDYRVRFETPSDGKTFVEQNAGVDDTSDSDVDTGTGVSDVAAVVSGQKTENVDAGIEEPPTPPGSLGGRYFCDTDDDNDDNNNGNEPAVVGLTVELLNADGTPALDNDGNPVASVLTDQNGEYCFDNLAPGDYRVRFETPSDGKTFVEQNAGVDDTSDSDVDTGTGVSDVAAVVSGQKTENVDAGIEEPPTPPGSLGGRYFCDTDDDNDDNNNGNEPAVVGLTVELLNADGTPALDNDGNPVASVLTDQNGEYCFDNLAPGDYRVRFETPSDGKTFVEQNAGVDDTSDSDVDTGTGVSDVAAVVSGQKTENVDAGIEEPAGEPEAQSDEGMACADDPLVVNDILANDSSPNGDGSVSVSSVAGISAGSLPSTQGAAAVLSGTAEVCDKDGNPIGTLDFDDLLVWSSGDGDDLTFLGGDDFLSLNVGEKAKVSFAYEIEDSSGQMATSSIDLTFCGTANTLQDIIDNQENLLPTNLNLPPDNDGVIPNICFEVRNEGTSIDPDEADDMYTLKLTGGNDGYFSGTDIFEQAYCLNSREILRTINHNQKFGDVPSNEQKGHISVLDENSDYGLKDSKRDYVGVQAVEMINWILNQACDDEFRFNEANWGVGDDLDDVEIQGAIWRITNNKTFLDEELSALTGSEKADADKLIELAEANSAGYLDDLGVGDKVALLVDSTEDPEAVGSNGKLRDLQPFVIGVNYEDIDCIC